MHCWTCSSCNNVVGIHNVLAISTGQGLPSDPVLGPEFALRFLPSRFSAAGNAVDPSGSECQELACPQCRNLIDSNQDVDMGLVPDLSDKEYSTCPLRVTLNELVSRLADGADPESLEDMFGELVRKLQTALGTTIAWIESGLSSEPRTYSEDLGNIVFISDQLISLGSAHDSLGSLTAAIDPESIRILNAHYADARMHESLVGRLRVLCYCRKSIPERASAIQSLRNQYPKEQQWVSQWHEIEPNLADWIIANIDDAMKIMDMWTDLKSMIPTTPGLQKAMDEADAVVRKVRHHQTKQRQESLARSIPKLVAGNQIEAVEKQVAEYESLLALRPEGVSPDLSKGINDAIKAIQFKREYESANLDVLQRSLELRQLLDEQARPSAIESSYDELRVRANAHGIEIDPGLRSRVSARLNEASKSALWKRRILVTAACLFLIAGAVTVLMWLELSRRTRIMAELQSSVSLMLARETPTNESSQSPTLSSLLATRPVVAIRLMDNASSQHRWLADDPTYISLLEQSAQLADEKEDALKLLRERLALIEDRMDNPRTNPQAMGVDVEDVMQLSLISGEDELIRASSKIEQQHNHFINQLDASILKEITVELEALKQDRDEILHELSEDMEAISRFDPEVWIQGSRKWNSIANRTSALANMAEEHELDIESSIIALQEEAIQQKTAASEYAKRLASFIQAVQLLERSANESVFFKRADDLLREYGDLLAEMNQRAELKITQQAAKSMLSVRHWREFVWPKVAIAIRDAKKKNIDVGPASVNLKLMLEEHQTMHPDSPYSEVASLTIEYIDVDVSPVDRAAVLRELSAIVPKNLIWFSTTRGNRVYSIGQVGEKDVHKKLLLHKGDIGKPQSSLGPDPAIELEREVTAGKYIPPIAHRSIVASAISQAMERIQDNRLNGRELSHELLRLAIEIERKNQPGEIEDIRNLAEDPLLRLIALKELLDIWVKNYSTDNPTLAQKIKAWSDGNLGDLLNKDWVKLAYQDNSARDLAYQKAAEAINKSPGHLEIEEHFQSSDQTRTTLLDSLRVHKMVAICGPEIQGRQIYWVNDRPQPGQYFTPVFIDTAAGWSLSQIESIADDKNTCSLSDSAPAGIIPLFSDFSDE